MATDPNAPKMAGNHIYGFGLAADRGPEGGAKVGILPPDTSIRARVVAIDGVSQEQAHQIALLLERIFQADHEGSGRWLREHCGPLGSTPIKALEDGRTEKVIAYLEAAAP